MNSGRADIRYLHSFLVVTESLTFAKAAEALRVTQPAVSYRMGQLENRIGTPLFERAGRRRILTPAGRELRAFCLRYVMELDALSGRLTGRPGPATEPVRIASVSGFGRYVLFPVLCSAPLRDLPIELVYETADEVFARVERGEADLGLVYRPKVSSYLDVRELCREELVLLAPAEGLELTAPTGPDDLEPLPFVTYEECGYVFGAWFEHHFGRQPARIRSARRFEELEEVVASVGLGVGLSVVPLDCASAALAAGRVRVVRLDGSPCLNAVYAITRSGAFRRDEIEAIVDAVGRRGTRRID